MSYWDTPGKVDELIRLYPDNSCSQVAAMLGGDISRNAVIGKLHRMGLVIGRKEGIRRSRAVNTEPKPKRRTQFRYAIKPNPGNRASTPRTTAERQAQAEQLAAHFAAETTADLTPEQRARTVGLMKLTEHTCKFPLGDPAKDDFCFCGDTPAADKVYCAAHWRLTHQTPSARANERPYKD